MFDQLTAVHVFEAPPETVFAAWLSPDSCVAPVTRIQVDPQIGGAFMLEADGGAKQAKMVGYFVAIEPAKRVTYSWHWLGDAESTLVCVTFHPAGPRTIVEVHHAGFLTEASCSIHRAGWSSYFQGLARRLP